MKSFNLPPNAFPPLNLTLDEQRWIRDEAKAVIAETLLHEKQFMNKASGRAVFPKSDWKQVRAKEDFAVYKERRSKRPAAASASKNSNKQSKTRGLSAMSTNATRAPTVSNDAPSMSTLDDDDSGERGFSVSSLSSDDLAASHGSTGRGGRARAAAAPQIPTSSSRSISNASGAWTSSSLGEDDSIVAAMKDPHVPMLVAAGCVEGTIEDACFGAQSGDEIAWRLRAAYAKDKFADAKILAKIDFATLQDPFQSLCVKWFTKELPALVGSFIQRRDFLIMETTGTSVDSDGEPYGWYLIHSVKLPGAPELTDMGVIRCKLSLGFICRQRPGNQTHIFARGFSDPRGELMEKVGVALTAESIIAATLVTECAYVKKLTYLMTKNTKKRQQKLQRAFAMAAPPPQECDSCHRATKKLGRTMPLHSCQSCGHMVCHKCALQKRIIIDVSGDGVVDRSLTFCFGCVLESKRMSSWQVATEAVPRTNQDRVHKTPQTVAPTQVAASVVPPLPLPRSQSWGVGGEDARATQCGPRQSTVMDRRGSMRTPHSTKSIGAGVVLY